MTIPEIIMTFFGSSIFLSIIGMFYRIGQHHKSSELHFEFIKKEIEKESSFLRDEIKKESSFLRYEIKKENSQTENSFNELKADIREIRSDIREIRKDVSRIDKEVGIITATLRFNGFDLDRHQAEGE
jgi:septal ring factor EnvC (AmiA/AmiB activator)